MVALIASLVILNSLVSFMILLLGVSLAAPSLWAECGISTEFTPGSLRHQQDVIFSKEIGQCALFSDALLATGS